MMAAAAAFFMVSPVFAGWHCIDADSHVEFIVDTMPMGEIAETLSGDELTVFLAAFNATPPATEYTGDRVVVIASEIMSDRVYAVLMSGDCVVFGGMMWIETLEKYRKGIPLTPAGWTI